ncbi:jg7011, partial [Pararge aegeria aegeria]
MFHLFIFIPNVSPYYIVTERLDDDSDIERERRALSVRGNMLARRFARCTTQVKLALFRAYCQSFYTCSLWTHYTQRTYSALRVQYNNVLRAVLKKPRRCSASEMFAEARVDDFYAIIRKRAASMMSRLVSSTNTLLST